jgi:hypothetical protein
MGMRRLDVSLREPFVVCFLSSFIEIYPAILCCSMVKAPAFHDLHRA